jgi:cell wall-associated NlpC family hydrolase
MGGLSHHVAGKQTSPVDRGWARRITQGMSVGLLAGCATVLVTTSGAVAAQLPLSTPAVHTATPPGVPNPGTVVPPQPVLPDGTTLAPPTGLPAPPPSPPVSPVVNTVQTQQAAVESLSEQLTQLKVDLTGKQSLVTAADQKWAAASEAYRLLLQGNPTNQQTSYLSMLGNATTDAITPQSEPPSATSLNAAAQAVVETAQGYAEAYSTMAQMQSQQATMQKQFDTQSASLKNLQNLYAAQLAAAGASTDAFNQSLSDQYALGPGGAAAPQALQAVAYALEQARQHKMYLWGAEGPDRFDCSGLVMAAYDTAGIHLPRTARPQWRATRAVQINALLPGDLVFFATDKSNWDTIHHVGIYLGNGKMVNAPHDGVPVQINSIWWSEFFGATRVVGAVPPGQSGPMPVIPPSGGNTGGSSGGSSGGNSGSGGGTKPKPPPPPTTVPPISKPPITPSSPPSNPPSSPSTPPSDTPSNPPATTPSEGPPASPSASDPGTSAPPSPTGTP